MALFRCKICGGDLIFEEGKDICKCEYCGSEQTVPKSTDESRLNLFNRANVLRLKAEFDKAAELYERILEMDETESEAYWGLILCNYGIEYVEDPRTKKMVPTCHRASYDSITSDPDYKKAIRYADVIRKSVYIKDAKLIDTIQKRILDIAEKEDSYDIFICYKEADENGKRTPDSVLANELYHRLRQEGYRVFYAAISLEDKIGEEYEPYVFSALSTSKIMLVVGTKPEYMNSVWVKNEWSRFLKRMKRENGNFANKLLLIPCYKDMDPYELPEEFAHLQAQDLSKLGAVQDIVHAIKKNINNDQIKKKGTIEKDYVLVSHTNVDTLLKRGQMELEDGDFEAADGFYEEALNQDPECAKAYLGKFLAEKELTSLKAFLYEKVDDMVKVSTHMKEACLEEHVHINEMAKNYAVPGYLDEDDIIGMYNFNRMYRSAFEEREKQRNGFLFILEQEKYLKRARQYADGDFEKTLNRDIEDALKILNDRTEKAKRDDEIQKERIRKEYREFIKATDEEVKELHEEALLQKASGKAPKVNYQANETKQEFDYNDIKRLKEHDSDKSGMDGLTALYITIFIVAIILIVFRFI